MMTTSRASQVDIETTPFYHCIARCVRQAYLCGLDAHSGRNFDHRKEWVLQRLALLAGAFAIDVCAYAIMCNHVHLVLHVDAQRAASWPDDEVARRVALLFPGAFSNQIGERKQTPASVANKILLWRERLTNLSWFMRCLNEFIARRANQEDDCKGRFWEGRFKSQALLDDGAVLACMSYVDLNPVRAGMARGLDDSDWTSIRQRLSEAAKLMRQGSLVMPEQGKCGITKREAINSRAKPTGLGSGKAQPKEAAGLVVPLAPLWNGEVAHHGQLSAGPVNISLMDYVELLEWTGRRMHPRKRGYIKEAQPPAQLLARCHLAARSWLDTLENFHAFAALVGSPQSIRRAAPKFKRSWSKGLVRARAMYGRLSSS